MQSMKHIVKHQNQLVIHSICKIVLIIKHKIKQGAPAPCFIYITPSLRAKRGNLMLVTRSPKRDSIVRFVNGASMHYYCQASLAMKLNLLMGIKMKIKGVGGKWEVFASVNGPFILI